MENAPGRHTISDQEDGDLENILPTLTDRIWKDLDGQVSKAEIQAVILEQWRSYEGAVVKTFVPIFIYRSAVSQLRAKTQGEGEATLVSEEGEEELSWEDLLLSESSTSR